MVEPVMLADGRVLDAETFYRERDHRTTITAPFLMPGFPVAVVLPPSLANTVTGQTALLWTCSMLRRMGRPFANVAIITPASAREASYRGALHRHLGELSLADAVDIELTGADPFAPFEWREPSADDAFVDMRMAIWIGTPETIPTVMLPDGHVILDARGWIAATTRLPSGLGASAQVPHSPQGEPLDAAAATVILASALAVGAVYAAATPQIASSDAPEAVPTRTWYALDSGMATADPTVGETWFMTGHSDEGAAPWSADTRAEPPSLEELVLVSAGGLGSNVGQILAASFITPKHVTVVEPDHVEISNLNRLIGVLVADTGSPKVAPVAATLEAAGIPTTSAIERYEVWSASGAASNIATPGCAVLVGVDQLATRLEVQADWPHVVINGGTSGTTWNVSAHPCGCGGCLGCVYGVTRQSYAASRRPMACGAGVANAPAQRTPVPDPSYPFASVSAAAAMVGLLIQHVWHERNGRSVHAARRAMNALRSAFATASTVSQLPSCLLMCSHPSLRDFFASRCQTSCGLNGTAGSEDTTVGTLSFPTGSIDHA